MSSSGVGSPKGITASTNWSAASTRARLSSGCSGRSVLLVASVGVVYVVFAFVGIGGEPFVYALGLIAAGLPLYLFMRLRRRRALPIEAMPE